MRIIDIVDISDWKKKKNILNELKSQGINVDERYIRQHFEHHNKRYSYHLEDKFIAHSYKCYKLTDDREEIISSVKDNRKRALKMLMQESTTLKALGENANLRITIKDGEMMMVDERGL